MTLVRAPIVGMHFHPPAKQVINMLPADTPLDLVFDPENQYDSWAIKVFADPKAIPKHYLPDLEIHLPGYGLNLDDLLQGPIWLGHIAMNSMKQPVGNREVLPLIMEPFQPDALGNLPLEPMVPRDGWTAKLAFSPDAKPFAVVERP